MLRKEKQPFFEFIIAPNAFEPLHARLLALYPALPFADFAFDDFPQLLVQANSVHMLEQKALKRPSFLLVAFRLEPFPKALNLVPAFHSRLWELEGARGNPSQITQPGWGSCPALVEIWAQKVLGSKSVA
jgi:hypothetical protein